MHAFPLSWQMAHTKTVVRACLWNRILCKWLILPWAKSLHGFLTFVVMQPYFTCCPANKTRECRQIYMYTYLTSAMKTLGDTKRQGRQTELRQKITQHTDQSLLWEVTTSESDWFSGFMSMYLSEWVIVCVCMRVYVWTAKAKWIHCRLVWSQSKLMYTVHGWTICNRWQTL